jgi:hypothetical protein
LKSPFALFEVDEMFRIFSVIKKTRPTDSRKKNQEEQIYSVKNPERKSSENIYGNEIGEINDEKENEKEKCE